MKLPDYLQQISCLSQMVQAQTCSGEKYDKTFSAQNHKVAAKYVETILDVLHFQNVYI